MGISLYCAVQSLSAYIVTTYLVHKIRMSHFNKRILKQWFDGNRLQIALSIPLLPTKDLQLSTAQHCFNLISYCHLEIAIFNHTVH